MDSSLQESNTIIQKDKELIEETPLELNITCPNHPEENILRLCIDSNTEKEILCVECLINLEDPQSLGKNLVSPGEFINIANEFYQKAEKNVSDPAEAPTEYTNLLLKQAENIEKVSSHIEKEKKKIELRFKTLIQEFSELCNKKMDEYLGQMDKQLFNFRYNYIYFEKQLNKVYPADKEENVPLYPSKEALTEKFQKVTNSTQLMTLVKNIKQDLKEANFNPSNSQESIEEVRKKNLETLAKTLQKQVTDLPAVSPSKDSTEAQTIKTLKESLEKSLSKLFEFEHEISDLTKGESAPNSKILTTPEQLSLLKHWLNRDVMNLKLLYRASKDGFTGTAFHQKCDGHADTITLIKAEGTNKIFGGYLDKSWETKEAWINSDKTFVFSLTSKEKYTIKVGHEMYAAYAGSSYGPSFGGGYDFHISGKSGGALLYSFEITDLNNFTGGSSFTCAEIEVFQITKGSGVAGGAEKSTSTGSIPKEAKTKVAERLGIDVSKFKLLYKGSDDGMTPENFHEKCDNKGPTVVFVKTKGSDDIIGGYTTQPWCAKENYALDNDAFVFSTERNLFCPVAIAESAVFQSGATGPYFGDDETLIIFKEKVSGNYNVIVNAYDCYQDGETFSNKGNSFEPEEVEVYEVSK